MSRPVTALLLTGMSGTGKSSVLAELSRRGHAVVDTDDDGWIEQVPMPGGGTEPMWREDRMAALLAERRDGPLFVSGCVANQGRFYDRFDAVVLLSAPRDVLLGRIASRTTNTFGKADAERAQILHDLEATEPLLRAGATVEISTTVPVAVVAERLEAIAGVPRS